MAGSLAGLPSNGLLDSFINKLHGIFIYVIIAYTRSLCECLLSSKPIYTLTRQSIPFRQSFSSIIFFINVVGEWLWD